MASTENNGSGLVDKLSNSLLVDPQKIPYAPLNRRQRSFNWSTHDKALFWTIPLLIFMGISALVFLVSEQETILKLDLLKREQQEDLRWNELIFTQLWGYSSCLQFKDKHPKNEASCRYEDLPAFWSIHGIWPTREGSVGPNFCAKIKFNGTELDPIRPSLNEYWYEIDNTKEGDNFWSHEWLKHGSCAMEANRFDTELKYFTAGLDMRKQYDLYSILKEKEIVPESQQGASGYTLDQITDAIQSSLGPDALPYVQCLEKKNSETNANDFYLLAIQLCFNKDLNFLECRKNGKVFATKLGDAALPCPSTAPIKYLDATL